MEKKKEFIVNVLYLLAIVAVLYAFFKFLFPALIPFIIGFVVACFIRFLAQKIGGKSEKARNRITLGLTICFYVLLFALALLLGLKVIDRISNLIQAIPDFYNGTIQPLLFELTQKLEEVALQFDESVAQEVENTLNEFQANIGKYVSDFSLSAVSFISDGIIGIPALVIRLIVTIISTFFFAVDFEKIMALVQKVIGEKRYGFLSVGYHHTKTVLLTYIKTYTLLFCITFIELTIGLTIFNIPYSVLVAFLIAIFDILPVLGTGGVLIPWSLICLFMGNTRLGIGIFILYLIIAIIRNTVEPKIVGQQLGLHPLATLMAMFIGMNSFGLIGLIFFPVSLVIIVNMVKAGSLDLPE